MMGGVEVYGDGVLAVVLEVVEDFFGDNPGCRVGHFSKNMRIELEGALGIFIP